MIDKVEKGLGFCSASNDTKYCSQCPYDCETHCVECLTQNALDILTKLRNENESLKKENKVLKAQVQAAEQTIRAITIKLREKDGPLDI